MSATTSATLRPLLPATSTATTANPTTDAGDLGTVLGIWAHPDDEAFLSAGLMAAARDAGLAAHPAVVALPGLFEPLSRPASFAT